MTPTRLLLAASMALVISAPAIAQQAGGRVRLEDRVGASVRATKTTLADQNDVAVTVYNNNLALVRDTRDIKMVPGEFALTFADVAQQIRPETVSLRSVSDPGAIQILEQNYEYDLMSPQKLMEKYVGKTVRLVNFSNDVGFTEVDAELLSVNQGSVYRIDGEIYLGHPGNVVLPEIPENLIAEPSLVWLLDNEGTDHEVEVTYLTGGLSWKADYVLRMNQDEDAMDIDAWVTLNNQSGATYTEAKLKLVAGDVNIVRPEQRGRLVAEMQAMRAAAPAMQEESFAEYHLYSLPRRTTIKENQSKQVSLFRAGDVAVVKEYEFRGQPHYYYQQLAGLPEEKVSVFLKFENEEDNNLGMPLPAGVMRIYQEDSDEMLQFAGEDRIEHTPKDETVRLRMGNAFDVVGERVQTDYNVISNRVFESAWKITLRNHKESDIEIDVVEPMQGDWEILSSSHAFQQRDARTAVFTIPVAADEEVELTYRIRVRN